MLLADRLSILEGDWRERADYYLSPGEAAAVAVINRALRTVHALVSPLGMESRFLRKVNIPN